MKEMKSKEEALWEDFREKIGILSTALIKYFDEHKEEVLEKEKEES